MRGEHKFAATPPPSPTATALHSPAPPPLCLPIPRNSRDRLTGLAILSIETRCVFREGETGTRYRVMRGIPAEAKEIFRLLERAPAKSNYARRSSEQRSNRGGGPSWTGEVRSRSLSAPLMHHAAAKQRRISRATSANYATE
jgi:hypothetical protein